MFVYQCVEGHAIPPACGEIVNVDVRVPTKTKHNRVTKQRLTVLRSAVFMKKLVSTEKM